MSDIKDFTERAFAECLETSDIPNELYDKYNVKKGLRNANGTGVLVLLTKISDVYGYKIVDEKKIDDDGHLYYRGYDIFDLIKEKQKFGFERVCYLILFSKLPTEEELNEFHEVLSNEYSLPKGFAEDVIFKNTSPSLMNQIQKAVLNLYAYDDSPDDVSPLETLRKGLNILAKMPSIISYSYRAKRHYIDGLTLHIRNPKREYSIAENILRMSRTHGDYTQFEVDTLDLALILHADHGGGNNSTFANLVVSSTATDIYSSMCASLGSLKGPRHGGANRAVRDMMHAIIDEIGLDASDSKMSEIANKLLNKEFFDKKGLIYGIGHPVYTKSDPRTILLKEKCKELALLDNEMRRFNFYSRFEGIAIGELKRRKGPDFNCCANIDFYSGLTYEILGINEDLYTPIFACARTIGWLAHNLENKLYCDKIIRPAGKYVGEIK